MHYILRITIGRPGDDHALHVMQYVGSRSRCRRGLAERYRRARAAGYWIARSPFSPMTALVQCQQGAIIRLEIFADPDGEHDPRIGEPMETISAN